MNKRKKILWISLVLALIVGFLLFKWAVIYNPPTVPTSIERYAVEQFGNDTTLYGPNWAVKNSYGEWVGFVEGAPYERGIALGEIHKSRIQSQEDAFVGQLEDHLPNAFYRNLLRVGIAWFNKNLDQSVPLEYRREIYGVSQFFSDAHDNVGPKYNRILNYHAAHDIGHMAQNMNLVACSAIAEWNDSTFYLGRNFDFYFGDEFAKNKIIQFYAPDSGYAFVSITWGGLCGVVSAMNETGLAITLNALPSEIPTESATPVSIIARDIVQYASTIDEAYQIASRYPVFVSESFTIASAQDHKAAVIEKTPDTTDIYFPEGNKLIVTNHFQGPVYRDSEINLEHIEQAESMDRFLRLKQLSEMDTTPLSPMRTLRMIRDQKGIDGSDLGIGNPMAINQLLAHHGVIFDPLHKIVWVSQAPYQEGVMMAFDLSDIRSMSASPNKAFSLDSLSLSEDEFLQTTAYSNLKIYREKLTQLGIRIEREEEISPSEFDEIADYNPAYYLLYKEAGDYFAERGELETARRYYTRALECQIPYESTVVEIRESMSL